MVRTREEINGEIAILIYQCKILENEPTSSDLSSRIDKLRAKIMILVTERNYLPARRAKEVDSVV